MHHSPIDLDALGNCHFGYLVDDGHVLFSFCGSFLMLKVRLGVWLDWPEALGF